MYLTRIIISLCLIYAVETQRQFCGEDDHFCKSDYKFKSKDFPSISSLVMGDYKFPARFFTEFCKSTNYKHGETGQSYDWLLNNDGFIQRLCMTTTAKELDKLVPCANNKSVRDNIIRSIADIKNIPKPTDDLTLEEARKGVCKLVTTSLKAFLKTLQSECDPRGYRAMTEVFTDMVQDPAKYKVNLLDLDSSCLTELQDILQLYR
uniref:Uncharacterized protein n=2 Tax=Magallana TaxID=2171616 RepID=A0A8W8LXD1_MAGGI